VQPETTSDEPTTIPLLQLLQLVATVVLQLLQLGAGAAHVLEQRGAGAALHFGA
jgi:hypothetical protein